MPTNPTARDVETARAIMASYRETPMWWSTEMAVSMATDAIARALATARAEERRTTREACAEQCEAYATEAEIIGGTATGSAARGCAAAIRARGEGATNG